MRKFFVVAALLMTAAAPVSADEFEETLELALEAYKDGDIVGAKEELDFANQILQKMRSAGFQNFLPEALDGWTRTINEDNSSAGLAMFGGGTMTGASYTKGSESFEIQLAADNNLVASLSAMLSNTTLMSSMGEMIRVKREKFVDQDGEIKGMVGKVLITASGNASREAKVAHLETMKFKEIEDY